MAANERLYSRIPDAYTRDPNSDLYKLLLGLSVGTEDLRAEYADFKNDITLLTADGQGLDWKGENYGIARPPGMLDNLYRLICLTMIGMKRGTIAAIKDLLETATGLSWTVQDKQLNASIPAGEVWVSVASGFTPSYGRGLYAGIVANTGDPVESSIVGDPLLNEEGEYGGTYNDHLVGNIDPWIKALVNKVKLAGVTIVYK